LTSLKLNQDEQAMVTLYCEIAIAYRYEKLDSAFYYADKSYDLAKKNGSNLGMAESALTLAKLHVTGNDLDQAREYYIEAADKYLEENRLFEHTQCRMVLGNIELTRGQYYEAFEIYDDCIPISLERNFDEILPHLYNNMGVIFLELKDYDQAAPSLEKAFDIFESQNDYYSSSHAANNLAYIYHATGENEKAINKYLSLVPYYLKEGFWTNLAELYTSVSLIYLDQGIQEKAKEYISLSKNILDNNHDNFVGPSSMIEARAYSTASRVELLDKNYQQSIEYARKSLQLAIPNHYQGSIINSARQMSNSFYALGNADSAFVYSQLFIQYQDSIINQKGINEIGQLKMQKEFEAKLLAAELESTKINAALERREMIYFVSVLVTLLLISLLVLLIMNQRKRVKAALLKKDNLELAQEKLQQQVSYKNKELTLNMMYLSEKNEFITTIARKLEGIKTDSRPENRLIIQQLINELRKNNQNKSWAEFEVRFMEVHSDFYDALNKAFPDLTPNEKRLCAFLRLNMTTKEISAITHQSVVSIKMARYRLRKKLDIDRDENLISYLANLSIDS
jgi:tetratricopeptide (TPR) repeat protein/DNA-binding CsgD family transcriptional regulator